MVALSDDGRYVLVRGRRWRATDPAIPEPLRREMVHELMAARRAVAVASSSEEKRLARDRVHSAKIALGERGRKWWERRSVADRVPRLRAAASVLLQARGAGGAVSVEEIAAAAGARGASVRPADIAGALRPLLDAGEIILAEERDGLGFVIRRPSRGSGGV